MPMATPVVVSGGRSGRLPALGLHWRDTRKVGGTGIGLYLVKHFVEAHGGKICDESEVGESYTVIFVGSVRSV